MKARAVTMDGAFECGLVGRLAGLVFCIVLGQALPPFLNVWHLPVQVVGMVKKPHPEGWFTNILRGAQITLYYALLQSNLLFLLPLFASPQFP